MGGDTRITQVKTGVKNHRRVMILKDSFGNALPGYLFYSFEEIHVVDYRYFTKNMRKYVADNKITDILFANNIFNAYSNKICKRYMRFLNQNDHTLTAPTKQKTAPNTTETDSSAKAVKAKVVPSSKPTEFSEKSVDKSEEHKKQETDPVVSGQHATSADHEVTG